MPIWAKGVAQWAYRLSREFSYWKYRRLASGPLKGDLNIGFLAESAANLQIGINVSAEVLYFT
jgi:hypothetical protein